MKQGKILGLLPGWDKDIDASSRIYRRWRMVALAGAIMLLASVVAAHMLRLSV